jgi:hypothetical protein
MIEKIAFVKTGWSERYTGEMVVGRHSHISQFKEAHERYNFLRAPDGSYYGYIPPIGKSYRTPQPTDPTDWFVVFVAAINGKGPLTVVGWYEGANFAPEYLPRPEYLRRDSFPTDTNGGEFQYCIQSKRAHVINAVDRRTTISGKHFGSTPIVYARGNGKHATWRNELADTAIRILGEVTEPPNIRTAGFPDQTHRAKVDGVAMEESTLYLESKGYRVTDRSKDNCGFDLLAKKRNKELHVEVKGTSMSEMHFFMSRNEREYMINPKFRMMMVTQALSSPQVSMLTKDEVDERFDLGVLTWEGRLKVRV